MITKEQTIEIARKRAQELGRELEESLVAIEHRGFFRRKTIVAFDVCSPNPAIGRHTSFYIDAKTGCVLREIHLCGLR